MVFQAWREEYEMELEGNKTSHVSSEARSLAEAAIKYGKEEIQD